MLSALTGGSLPAPPSPLKPTESKYVTTAPCLLGNDGHAQIKTAPRRQRRKAIAAALPVNDDLYGMLKTLRDQLNTSDYMETPRPIRACCRCRRRAVGRCRLRGLHTVNDGSTPTLADELSGLGLDITLADDASLPGGLADLMGTLKAQLRALPDKLEADPRVLAAWEASKKGEDDDWETASYGRRDKKVYSKETLLGVKELVGAEKGSVGEELAARYASPEITTVAGVKDTENKGGAGKGGGGGGGEGSPDGKVKGERKTREERDKEAKELREKKREEREAREKEKREARASREAKQQSPRSDEKPARGERGGRKEQGANAADLQGLLANLETNLGPAKGSPAAQAALAAAQPSRAQDANSWRKPLKVAKEEPLPAGLPPPPPPGHRASRARLDGLL